jgi:CRP-like cAMP-binding protein
MDLSALRKFSLLSDFSDAELTDLFANATEQRFSPGAFLCREGDKDGHLYFLINGEVEVTKKDHNGRAHVLARLSGGTLLGELAWIMGTPCGTSLQARQETLMVQLDGSILTQELQERSPGAFKLGMALLKLLASRLVRMNEQFLELQIKAGGPQKSEIERLRERVLHDWSF